MENFERMRSIVHDVTGIPNELIQADSTADELKLDSLDMTELILAVEEEFDILVEDEENIRTIADLMGRVETQVA